MGFAAGMVGGFIMAGDCTGETTLLMPAPATEPAAPPPFMPNPRPVPEVMALAELPAPVLPPLDI